MTEKEYKAEQELVKQLADKLADWFGHPLGYYSEFFYDRAKELVSITIKAGWRKVKPEK